MHAYLPSAGSHCVCRRKDRMSARVVTERGERPDADLLPPLLT